MNVTLCHTWKKHQSFHEADLIMVVVGGDGCGVDEDGSGGSKEHGDGYNMQMGAIIHLLTRFERRH